MTSWDVARLTARLGDHNIRTHSETMHIERKIKRVVRHRGFDMRTLVKRNPVKFRTHYMSNFALYIFLFFSTTIYPSLL